MVGKFLLGMVSGGLLVTGGLVVGSMLFPVHPANDNRAVAPVEEAIEAPAATVADAGEAVAKPETAASEPEPAAALPEPTATPEPTLEPEAVKEPAVAAPESAPEPAVAPAPEPEVADSQTTEPAEPAVETEPVAEPAQPEVADALPAPDAPKPETAAVEAVAPEAGKVTAPETAAEPSKPADTSTSCGRKASMRGSRISRHACRKASLPVPGASGALARLPTPTSSGRPLSG